MKKKHDSLIQQLLAAIGAFGLVWAACCGCTRTEAGIEGTVTLDGQPLQKGQIVFTPQPGAEGSTAGAEITDGVYSVAPVGGILRGRFRVEITALRPTGRKIPRPHGGPPLDEEEHKREMDRRVLANLAKNRTIMEKLRAGEKK